MLVAFAVSAFYGASANTSPPAKVTVAEDAVTYREHLRSGSQLARVGCFIEVNASYALYERSQVALIAPAAAAVFPAETANAVLTQKVSMAAHGHAIRRRCCTATSYTSDKAVTSYRPAHIDPGLI